MPKKLPYYNSPSTSTKNTSIFPPMPQEYPENQEYIVLLEAKERDLELAAILGKSLLEQNKELQEKNEFLEESLNTSNETISQLRYQLKQRSSLVQAITNLSSNYDDCFYDGNLPSTSSPKKSDDQGLSSFQRQIKYLENGNKNLEIEVDRLVEKIYVVESREQKQLEQYLLQLREANSTIADLQKQISLKTKDCEKQSEEIQRLLKEISQRKSREQNLWDENDDLQTRLEQIAEEHEQLKIDMETLQDKHFEVVSVVKDKEEELRAYRQRVSTIPRRTASTDSLYDSLASELEASDSGCYNTPLFSARFGPLSYNSNPDRDDNLSNRPNCTNSPNSDAQNEQEFLYQADQVQSTFSDTGPFDDNSSALQPINQPQISPGGNTNRQAYDIPSQALLSAVLTSLDERNRIRKERKSPTGLRQPTIISPSISNGSVDAQDHLENGPYSSTTTHLNISEENEKLETPADNSPFVAPLLQAISVETTNQKRHSVTFHSSSEKQQQNPEKQRQTNLCCTCNKEFRDIACSPIQFSVLTEEVSFCQQKIGNCLYFETTNRQVLPSPETSLVVRIPQLSVLEQSEPSSDDSFENYSPRKMGEPGRPGTRDLGYSIRRLRTMDEINQKYREFRHMRGLIPSDNYFYSSSFIKELKNNYQRNANSTVNPFALFKVSSRTITGFVNETAQISKLSPEGIKRIPTPSHQNGITIPSELFVPRSKSCPSISKFCRVITVTKGMSANPTSQLLCNPNGPEIFRTTGFNNRGEIRTEVEKKSLTNCEGKIEGELVLADSIRHNREDGLEAILKPKIPSPLPLGVIRRQEFQPG